MHLVTGTIFVKHINYRRGTWNRYNEVQIPVESSVYFPTDTIRNVMNPFFFSQLGVNSRVGISSLPGSLEFRTRWRGTNSSTLQEKKNCLLQKTRVTTPSVVWRGIASVFHSEDESEIIVSTYSSNYLYLTIYLSIFILKLLYKRCNCFTLCLTRDALQVILI